LTNLIEGTLKRFVINGSSIQDISVNRLTIVGTFGLIMLTSRIFLLPDLILGFLSAFFMVIMPLLLGHDLLTFVRKKPFVIFSNLDIISKSIIFWIIGSLFVYHLTIFSAALKFNFIIVPSIVLLILIVGSLHKNLAFGTIKFRDFLRPQETKELDEREQNQMLSEVKKPTYSSESRRKNLFLVLIIIAIGISATLFFRIYEPFPTYMTAEFVHFGKSLQIIDDLGNLKIVEKSYFVIYYANQSVASFLFNVHPLSIVWVLPFLQSIFVASGIFALGMLLFKKTIPSLIAAFISMWVLGGAPVQNNPYVFSNGTIQYAIFILTLYLITKNFQKSKIQFNNRSILVTLLICAILPALIFIQRLAVGSDSIIATLFIPLLPYTLIIYKRNELLSGGKFQFALILLTAFTFMAMIHPFVSPLFILLSIVYTGLLVLVMRNGKSIHRRIRWIIPTAIILASILFYVVQATGLLEFSDHFMLSKHLFGSIYQGVTLADNSFDDKVDYINKGATQAVLASFLLGGSMMYLYSFRGQRIYMPVVTLCAISFLIYYLPEGWFIRSRFLVVLVSLVIAGGSTIIIKLCENAFYKLARFHGNIAFVKFMSAVIVLIIFVPILYGSTIPFRNTIDSVVAQKQIFSSFDPYEYDGGKWLRQNMPHDTLVVSDPYTINLMTELSDLKPPYERKWVEQNEYSQKSLQTMSDIRSKFFLDNNNYDRKIFLNKMLTDNNATSVVIIINNRTEKWLSTDKLILVSYAGLRDVKQSDIDSLINQFPIKLVYTGGNKVYIFKYNALQ